MALKLWLHFDYLLEHRTEQVLCVLDPTFRAERVALQVKGSSAQCHLLEDDAEAVDVSFLSSLRRRRLHPEQLWSHPQPLCRRRTDTTYTVREQQVLIRRQVLEGYWFFYSFWEISA